MRREFRFSFPAAAAPPPAELARARLLGFDRMPWPADVAVEADALAVARELYEGPALAVPWSAGDAGQLVVQTGALMARPEPYRLPLEAARGELAKLRNETAEWRQQGLASSEAAERWSRLAHARFQEAVRPLADGDADAHAALALAGALRAQEELARDFARHAIPARRRHFGALPQVQGGYDDTMPTLSDPARLRQLFDGLVVPAPWAEISAAAGLWNFQSLDWRVQWCLDHGFAVTLGPLIEPDGVPGWLRNSAPESAQLQALAFVAAIAERYGGRVKRWIPMGRFDAAAPPGWTAEDGLGLLRLLLESLRDRVDDVHASALLGQPWGETLGQAENGLAPVIYADEVSRFLCPPQALRLEVAMGYGARGSLCRTSLELSRLLDHYHQFGLDAEVVLHYPAAPQDEVWDGWRGPPTPARQAQWLEHFLLVALGKRCCAAAAWGNVRDAPGQRWPASGLLAADGTPRPALKRLRAVRRACG